MKKLFFVLLIIAAAFLLPSAEMIMPAIATTIPPIIDGKLDDPAWQSQTPFTAFKTFKPDWGKEASEKSEVYMTYDSTHLYFGIRCFDSEPAKIKAAMSKRDNIDADDWFGILLDTFNDGQSAYLFGVNPLGIQLDGTSNSDGNGDGSFDTVWKSHGQIDDRGYTAEIAIPFKSIRFPFKKNLVMRVGFFRVVTRKSEQSSFPEFDPEKGSLLSQLMNFEVTGITYKRPVEILPAMTFSQSGNHEGGRFVQGKGKAEFSLTGKVGITSEMTLDTTLNPDFSQVETDAGQIDVNLRYALYYPEKRPFFLEGLDNFNFSGRFEANPLGAIVHTRTIVDPILGVKVNGKMGSKNTLSAIFAMDEYPGEEEGENSGKNAYFTIFRYKRALKKDSYVGGFLTNRDFAGSTNRLIGSDGRLRLTNTSIFEYHFFESFSRERATPSTSSGGALSLRYNYATKKWNIDMGYIDIGNNFRTDVGYLTRTGIRMFPLFAMYSFYPKSKFFQKIEPFYWSTHSWDKPSGLFETTNVLVLRFWMPRNSQIRFDAILGNEVFAKQRYPINSWRIQASSQILKKLYINGQIRQGRSIYYDPDAPYAGHSTRTYVGLIYQPTAKLSVEVDVSYENFFRQSNDEKIYAYTILYNRTVYQFNKYLFLRGIFEYNVYRKKFNADLLASFTYIPGTVIYLGYGSLYEKTRWDGNEYTMADRFLTSKRSLFFKASYLWRL